MICNNCKHNLPDDSEFCQYCGKKIEIEEVVAPVEEEPNIDNMTQEELINYFLKMQAKEAEQMMEANRKEQPGDENSEDFGLVPENPIFTHAKLSVKGEKEYLNKLYTSDGQKIEYNRSGSVYVETVNGMVDVYETFLPSGELYKTIYVNMYGAKTSEKVPVGFSNSAKPKIVELVKDTSKVLEEPVITKVVEENEEPVIIEPVNEEPVADNIEENHIATNIEDEPIETKETVQPTAQETYKKQGKKRYCRQCGHLVDSETKVCTGCGKKYFKFNKLAAIAVILSIVIVAVSTLCAVEFIYIRNLEWELYYDELTIESLNNKKLDLEAEIKKNDSKLAFYDSYVVVLPDDGTNTYHKYGCSNLNTSKGVWILSNGAAAKEGYTKCTHCID